MGDAIRRHEKPHCRLLVSPKEAACNLLHSSTSQHETPDWIFKDNELDTKRDVKDRDQLNVLKYRKILYILYTYGYVQRGGSGCVIALHNYHSKRESGKAGAVGYDISVPPRISRTKKQQIDHALRSHDGDS